MNNTKATTPISSFLTLANQEYEALATYCNSLSQLSYAVHNSPQSATMTPMERSIEAHIRETKNVKSNNNNNIRFRSNQLRVLEPNLFLKKTSSLQESRELQFTAVGEYHDALHKLQSIHAQLKQCHDVIINDNQRQNDDGGDDTIGFVKKHLELSTRVLKTCASSMKSGYGPFFENGMLKNIGGGGAGQAVDSDSIEDWHDIRIVALTAYRGSIARLKQVVDTV